MSVRMPGGSVGRGLGGRGLDQQGIREPHALRATPGGHVHRSKSDLPGILPTMMVGSM